MSMKTMMATVCAALLSAFAAGVVAQEATAGDEKRAQGCQGCCLSAYAGHGSACAGHGSAKDGSGAVHCCSGSMHCSGANHCSAARHCTGTKDASGNVRCSLTGRAMDASCCTEKDGKTHCTTAGHEAASCCRAPATDDTETTDDNQDGGEAQE